MTGDAYTDALNRELDRVLGSGMSEVWLAVFTGKPKADFSNEAFIPRVRIDDPRNWLPATDGIKTNAAVIMFPPAIEDQLRVTHIAYMTDANGADAYEGLPAAKMEVPLKIDYGGCVTFAPGTLRTRAFYAIPRRRSR